MGGGEMLREREVEDSGPTPPPKYTGYMYRPST